jgi:hypothetical protein
VDETMKAAQLLHYEFQSLWLDNITRDRLDSGTLQRYISERTNGVDGWVSLELAGTRVSAA